MILKLKKHGKGTYYYHMYSDEKIGEAAQNGGVYRGEFKENSRHGIGTYLLPDGSTYTGAVPRNFFPCHFSKLFISLMFFILKVIGVKMNHLEKESSGGSTDPFTMDFGEMEREMDSVN